MGLAEPFGEEVLQHQVVGDVAQGGRGGRMCERCVSTIDAGEEVRACLTRGDRSRRAPSAPALTITHHHYVVMVCSYINCVEIVLKPPVRLGVPYNEIVHD